MRDEKTKRGPQGRVAADDGAGGLGGLTEFKRSSNGAVEVKLTDRAAVLVKLLEQLKDAEGAGTAAFLEALDRGGEKGGGRPA